MAATGAVRLTLSLWPNMPWRPDGRHS